MLLITRPHEQPPSANWGDRESQGEGGNQRTEQGVRNPFKWLSLWGWYIMKLGYNGGGGRIPGARLLVFTLASSAAESKQQRTALLSVKRTQSQSCKWHERPSVQLLCEKLHYIAPSYYRCQPPWCLKAKPVFLSCHLSTFLAFLTLCHGSELAWKAHLNLSSPLSAASSHFIQVVNQPWCSCRCTHYG